VGLSANQMHQGQLAADHYHLWLQEAVQMDAGTVERRTRTRTTGWTLPRRLPARCSSLALHL
jgi:hypothetical protein